MIWNRYQFWVRERSKTTNYSVELYTLECQISVPTRLIIFHFFPDLPTPYLDAPLIKFQEIRIRISEVNQIMLSIPSFLHVLSLIDDIF